jgi:hypothetical protein
MARELPSVPELARHGGFLCPEPARGVGAGMSDATIRAMLRSECRTRGLAHQPLPWSEFPLWRCRGGRRITRECEMEPGALRALGQSRAL